MLRSTTAMPHGQIVTSEFVAHPLLRNGHLQTLWPALMRPTPALDIRRERIELPDGDFVDLGWSGEDNSDGPIAILVHGLTGGFESKYLRGLSRQLIAQGWRTAMLQLRGAGPEPNRTRELYFHGDTADLRHVVKLLRKRERQTPIAAAGWSLGANVLLKYMAEEGDRALVSVAAAICAPFRLMACAKRLREGFSRQYQDSLLKDLRAMLRRKHAVVPVPDGVNLEGALRARDFIEFDDAYTAPLHGFRDAADYYARCESAQFLKLIRRPTLIVNAADDPFMGPDILPKARQLPPSVTLEVARSGGHVGFVAAGRFGQPVYWLEQHLAQYLVSSIAETHSSHESLVSAEVPG